MLVHVVQDFQGGVVLHFVGDLLHDGLQPGFFGELRTIELFQINKPSMVNLLFHRIDKLIVKLLQPRHHRIPPLQRHKEPMYLIGDHLIVLRFGIRYTEFLTNLINNTVNLEIQYQILQSPTGPLYEVFVLFALLGAGEVFYEDALVLLHLAFEVVEVGVPGVTVVVLGVGLEEVPVGQPEDLRVVFYVDEQGEVVQEGSEDLQLVLLDYVVDDSQQLRVIVFGLVDDLHELIILVRDFPAALLRPDLGLEVLNEFPTQLAILKLPLFDNLGDLQQRYPTLARPLLREALLNLRHFVIKLLKIAHVLLETVSDDAIVIGLFEGFEIELVLFALAGGQNVGDHVVMGEIAAGGGLELDLDEVLHGVVGDQIEELDYLFADELFDDGGAGELFVALDVEG